MRVPRGKKLQSPSPVRLQESLLFGEPEPLLRLASSPQQHVYVSSEDFLISSIAVLRRPMEPCASLTMVLASVIRVFAYSASS